LPETINILAWITPSPAEPELPSEEHEDDEHTPENNHATEDEPGAANYKSVFGG